MKTCTYNIVNHGYLTTCGEFVRGLDTEGFKFCPFCGGEFIRGIIKTKDQK